MLLWGAASGLVLALAAQPFVAGEVSGELVPLVRIALVAPAAIFVLWWTLAPGLTLRHARAGWRTTRTAADEATIPRSVRAAADADAYASATSFPGPRPSVESADVDPAAGAEYAASFRRARERGEEATTDTAPFRLRRGA